MGERAVAGNTGARDAGVRDTPGGLDRRTMLAGLGAAISASLAAVPASARGAPYPGLQALIDAYVAEGLVPGAIVGVLNPGRFAPVWMTSGKTLFEGGTAVTPRTLWRIFSMTKPVTGVAVMQQVAAGRLGIDTPIADIMPEFRNMRVLVDPARGLESRPAEKPILVRHLLTHSAGFSYTIAGNGPLEKAYQEQGLQATALKALLTPGGPPPPPLRTYMERLATLPLLYEPGSRWHYSIGLDVAGALLERLTGKPLDAVFESQLFGPLGMKDSGFWVPQAKRARLSGLYAWSDIKTQAPTGKPELVDGPFQTEWAQRPDFLAGGAGLISSADDYARFAQMMLNEGQFEGRAIIPRTVARLAMSNQMERGIFFDGFDGNGSGGRAILSDRRAVSPGTYGVGTWGWGGAASTLFHVDPVRGQAFVLMLQSIGNPNGPSETRYLKAINTAS